LVSYLQTYFSSYTYTYHHTIYWPNRIPYKSITYQNSYKYTYNCSYYYDIYSFFCTYSESNNRSKSLEDIYKC